MTNPYARRQPREMNDKYDVVECPSCKTPAIITRGVTTHIVCSECGYEFELAQGEEE